MVSLALVGVQTSSRVSAFPSRQKGANLRLAQHPCATLSTSAGKRYSPLTGSRLPRGVRKVVTTMALKEPSYDPLLKAVGKVVQEKRMGLGISQEELARRAKLHRTYVSDVERGERSVSLITLCKLAEALHTDASLLVQSAESLHRMR